MRGKINKFNLLRKATTSAVLASALLLSASGTAGATIGKMKVTIDADGVWKVAR